VMLRVDLFERKISFTLKTGFENNPNINLKKYTVQNISYINIHSPVK